MSYIHSYRVKKEGKNYDFKDIRNFFLTSV